MKKMSKAERLIDLAMVAYSCGLYGAAIERLNKVLDLRPQDWETAMFLGRAFQAAGQTEKAKLTYWHIYLRCPEPTLRSRAYFLMLPLPDPLPFAEMVESAGEEMTHDANIS